MLRQYKEVLTSAGVGGAGWSSALLMMDTCISSWSVSASIMSQPILMSTKCLMSTVMNDQLSLQLPIIVLPRIYWFCKISSCPANKDYQLQVDTIYKEIVIKAADSVRGCKDVSKVKQCLADLLDWPDFTMFKIVTASESWSITWYSDNMNNNLTPHSVLPVVVPSAHI